MRNPLSSAAILALLLACTGCGGGSDAGAAKAGLQPLTDPAKLTLYDLALLADPPPGAHHADCRQSDAGVAGAIAAAEARSFAPARARLVAWGTRGLGGRRAGRLWTLENEVTDPASGMVQLVQRDYLINKDCAYWPLAQKLLEWRRKGSVAKPGEGSVLIH